MKLTILQTRASCYLGGGGRDVKLRNVERTSKLKIYYWDEWKDKLKDSVTDSILELHSQLKIMIKLVAPVLFSITMKSIAAKSRILKMNSQVPCSGLSSCPCPDMEKCANLQTMFV